MTGIGIDVVGIHRFARSLRRRDEFAREVFSAGERRTCASLSRPEAHLAARFAAKEAFLKALGRGLFSGVRLPEIEVVGGTRTPFRLRLGPEALRALRAAGARSALVSLTILERIALALVVVQ